MMLKHLSSLYLSFDGPAYLSIDKKFVRELIICQLVNFLNLMNDHCY